MIGANAEAIATAEDREQFKEAMIEIGLECRDRGVARNMDEAREVVAEIGLPAIIRPAFILGGRGTGIAAHRRRVRARSRATASTASPIGEILDRGVDRRLEGVRARGHARPAPTTA